MRAYADIYHGHILVRLDEVNCLWRCFCWISLVIRHLFLLAVAYYQASNEDQEGLEKQNKKGNNKPLSF